MVFFGQKCLYSCKAVSIRAKSGCIPEKVVAFGQKWLYSCRNA